MDVSIILVNYKTKDLTKNAINSVIEKTNGIEYEIFVVDNNSMDGSIEAIEYEFPNINIVKNSVNAGFGTANNIAIKQAKGKYVLCLNTDTLLINNAIKIMFDFMEKEENKNVGVCGGYLTDGDGYPCYCGGHFPTLMEIIFKCGFKNIFPNLYMRKYIGGLKSDQLCKLENIDYVTGADFFVRKSVLDNVGLFDENIFMYFEETELCKRLKDAGYKIKIEKNAKIQHLEGKSNNDILKLKKMMKKSEFYYFKKHHPFQFPIVKMLYLFMNLFDWLILKQEYRKEMCMYILNNCK